VATPVIIHGAGLSLPSALTLGLKTSTANAPSALLAAIVREVLSDLGVK
jgi:hypothetical protein